MSDDTPLHNSSFIIHNSTVVPVYHWRGARPHPLDLDQDQSGWAVCLYLVRQGECCLLPIAWQADGYQDEEEILQTSCWLPAATFATQALDQEALSLTLGDLRRDGWAVNGRLVVTFTGTEVDSRFNERVEAYLWKRPS